MVTQVSSKLSDTSQLRKSLGNPWQFRFYLLSRLPLAFFAGLRIERFDENISEVSVPYRYSTKNPFKSIYFAALAMAAELSSGIQALDAVQRAPKSISMLVKDMKADFTKKARSRIYFKSKGAKRFNQAVEACLQQNEGQTVTVHTSGYDQSGQKVATFWFTWTFKQKQYPSKNN